jgi:hypothetical protein
MEEFNTLATIYGKASVNFIRPEFQVVYQKMPAEHPLQESGDTVGAGHVPVAPQSMAHPAVVPREPAISPAPDGFVADLLGFDTPAAPPVQASPPTAFSRASGVTMTGDEYQSKWAAISDADAIVSTVALSNVPATTGEVESKLAGYSVVTMASGELPTEFKFFLYAKEAITGNMFLIQSNIGKAGEPLMIVTVKVSSDAGSANQQQQVDHLIREIQKALG